MLLEQTDKMSTGAGSEKEIVCEKSTQVGSVKFVILLQRFE